jgi:deazaflavin-dependent oxidoreductase (nitroreductase family)
MTESTQASSGRDWTWTPSPNMNRFMSTMLRLPVLHRMLSGSMLLITFTGRKSGKTYTTPVSYVQDGQTVYILTKRFRKWWHNFRDAAPVTLHLRGHDVHGTAKSLTDANAIEPLRAFLRADPRSAGIMGIDPDVPADAPDSVEQMVEKVVLIAVKLN